VELLSGKEKLLQFLWVLRQGFAVFSQTFAKNVSRNGGFAVFKPGFAI
jgi:hypothetical protein